MWCGIVRRLHFPKSDVGQKKVDKARASAMFGIYVLL